MMENKFDMNDKLDQFAQIRKMGGAGAMLSMLPGGSGIDPSQVDEKAFDRIEAMIYSMTKEEREKPSIINPKRKRRIAAGSGTTVADVNKLLKQFEMMQKMMLWMFPIMYIFSGIAMPFAVLVYWLTNNICNLLRSIWQIHVFPTPGSPAAEAKEKRDHVHENARRAKAGLPSLEEEALQKAKEAAEGVLEQIDLIKKAILARAFRGELGTNDPTEESAVELLKTIM